MCHLAIYYDYDLLLFNKTVFIKSKIKYFDKKQQPDLLGSSIMWSLLGLISRLKLYLEAKSLLFRFSVSQTPALINSIVRTYKIDQFYDRTIKNYSTTNIMIPTAPILILPIPRKGSRGWNR